jgi:transposase
MSCAARVRNLLGIKEPRMTRRADTLNCVHLGGVSSDVARSLNVEPKTIANVGNEYSEDGTRLRHSMRRHRVGRSI